MTLDLDFALCKLRNCGYEPQLSTDSMGNRKITVKYFDEESLEIAKNFIARNFKDITVVGR